MVQSEVDEHEARFRSELTKMIRGSGLVAAHRQSKLSAAQLADTLVAKARGLKHLVSTRNAFVEGISVGHGASLLDTGSRPDLWSHFDRRVIGLGIEQVLAAPRSPWLSTCVERVIGSIRRECLDHVIVLDEGHLRRILRGYLDYYHSCRTHLSLQKDAPDSRPIDPPELGNVMAIPKVGGLHHHYIRRAA